MVLKKIIRWILFCRFRLRGRTRLQTSCNFRREPFYSLVGRWSSSDVLGPWRDLREDQQGCKQVPCENCMMSVTAFYPSLCVSQIWWILFTSPMVTKVCDIWVSIRRCVSQIWWILFCRFRLRGRTRLQTSCNFRREPFYSLFGPPQMSLAHGGTSGRTNGGCKQVPCENCTMCVTAFYPFI